MENNDTTIDILGQEWLIRYVDDDPAFKVASGYCEGNERQIVIQNIKIASSEIDESDGLELSKYAQTLNQKRVLRHEIIHAYLIESGLDADSHKYDDGWATNEEMVDWFARQSPKIFKTYKELKLI